ncbi:MAG: hypothetical protein AAGI03_05815 [Pseudomonadota bacterium]
MLRSLVLVSAVALVPAISYADGHLAGGPMPTVTSHSVGECQTITTTEVVRGVRIHRSRTVGCEPKASPERESTESSRPVEITVNTRVNLAPPRRGTTRHVAGAPGYWKGTGTRENYVLGGSTF